METELLAHPAKRPFMCRIGWHKLMYKYRNPYSQHPLPVVDPLTDRVQYRCVRCDHTEWK